MLLGSWAGKVVATIAGRAVHDTPFRFNCDVLFIGGVDINPVNDGALELFFIGTRRLQDAYLLNFY